MTPETRRYLGAAAAAIGLHAVAAITLALADVDVEPDYADDETEVSLEELPPLPEPKEPEKEAEIEEPEPEPPPEPPPDDPPPDPPPDDPPPDPPPADNQPDVPSTDTPAPGEDTPVVPGGMIDMGDIAPTGTMKVPGGSRTTAGTAGTGDAPGGGGGTDEGTGPPKPVSIASIKRKAMPIGDTDYANLGKNYPPVALKRKIEGDVVVKLIVDAKGKVTSRRIVKGPGFGLNKRALSLARKLRFKPAIDNDDRPVASVVVWTFSFTLPD